MALKVFGIPNCGTCKKAIKWLDEQQLAYEFINTRKAPPTEEAIRGWVEALGSKPMRNTSGQSYRALGEAKANWDDEAWIRAFASDAMLLKRPLFEKDGRAVLAGFRAKEEVLLDLLQ